MSKYMTLNSHIFDMGAKIKEIVGGRSYANFFRCKAQKNKDIYILVRRVPFRLDLLRGTTA